MTCRPGSLLPSLGLLATLGVNSYFTGTSAADISVNNEVIASPSLLSAGNVVDGQSNDNGAAMGIVALRDTPLSALNGTTFNGQWDQAVQSIATQTDAAKTTTEAATTVKESLDAQRSAISGVNVDEEAINLITYQRQYQASARFISVVDDLTQTLLGLVR